MTRRIVPSARMYDPVHYREIARVVAVGVDRLRAECPCGWTGPAWLRTDVDMRMLLGFEIDAHNREHGLDV